jgi:hypothetical protein
MTTVRLALSSVDQGVIDSLSGPEPVALLVSYAYIHNFKPSQRAKYVYRDWVLDSGAFTAHNAGRQIDLRQYIEDVRELRRTDPTLSEVFALDVIGNWRASLKNCEAMMAAGLDVIPAFHPGEPWDALKVMARDYDKIAIGGVVGWPARRKQEWVGQVFARAWPARIHGFGMSSENVLMQYPLHSCDATNWCIQPWAFGSWKSFGNTNLRGMHGHVNVRAEVDYYLRLERKVRGRWRKQLEELEILRPRRSASPDASASGRSRSSSPT